MPDFRRRQLILPRLPRLLRRIRQTVADIVATRPDALISIDSPDFTLRVARLARRALPDLAVVHYVAPSVWAWRPGRAARMARHVDHVLALLPFEPPYMTAAGVSCDFVGHPAAAFEREPMDDLVIQKDLGLAAAASRQLEPERVLGAGREEMCNARAAARPEREPFHLRILRQRWRDFVGLGNRRGGPVNSSRSALLDVREFMFTRASSSAGLS